MRQAGPVLTAGGLGAHDHLCWSHRGTAEFLEQALPYLADGVHRGQRISYIGTAPEDELRARLERRAQDSVGNIEKRLQNARREMDHFNEYDYIIVNEDLEKSVARVRSILVSARLERERQLNLSSFVKDLQNQIDSL